MKCKVPEISWHNRDPVLSVDLQVNRSSKECYRLATGGSDCHVLIWNLTFSSQIADIDLDLIAELGRHQRSVNVVRWSPNGELLASGDDESVIIIWKQKLNELPNICGKVNDKEIWTTWKVLRGHLEDIYDISWSPNSQFLISGSVDNSAIVWNVDKGISTAVLNDHKGYVQGVAWDPKNQLLATLSSDRYMRIYDVQTKRILYRIKKGKFPISDQHNVSDENVDLFHDDTLQTFFRRLCFTPDGKLLLTPAGIREFDGNIQSLHTTYIFNRFSFFEPTIVLPSQDQYTVAIRCCPTLFSLRPFSLENTPIIDLPYRIIFAVASRSSVYFYDTQQRHPFALVSNIHYTRLTDLSWSHDGRILIVSSTDGFCSIISFESNELGEIYEKSEDILNKVAIKTVLIKKQKKKFKENQLKIKKKVKLWKKFPLVRNNTSKIFRHVIDENNHKHGVDREKFRADLKVNKISKHKFVALVESTTIESENDQKHNFNIESNSNSIFSNTLEDEVGDLQTLKPINVKDSEKIIQEDKYKLVDVNVTENLLINLSNTNKFIFDEKSPRRVALKTISTPKSKKQFI